MEPQLDLGPLGAGSSVGSSPPTMIGNWSQWIEQPGNRQMLIQAGLALLQPIGVGQSLGGHLASAVGSGFEAKDRAVAGQLEQQNTETGRQLQREQLEISRKNAETARLGLAAKLVPQLTPYQESQLRGKKTTAFLNYVNKRITDSFGAVDPVRDADKLYAEFEALYGKAEGGGSASTGTPATLSEALASGIVRQYNGKSYRFKGGENKKENWEEVNG